MKALVLGITGGIGAAVAAHLARQMDVTGLSRKDGLDWTKPVDTEAALIGLDGPFDLIFDATGALQIGEHGPEKKLSAIDADAMAAQFAVNTIGPALILKHSDRLIPRDRRAVLATISARVGSISDNGLGGWVSYRAAKAALNQIVKTASVELARTRPEAIIAALHPGTVATGLSAPFAGQRKTLTPEESAARMIAVLDGLTPAQSGGFFAYDGQAIPW
ncbi:MAG: SDR family NAD(P)-dependent oxidoreductase [Pseudomonadota bacterium]